MLYNIYCAQKPHLNTTWASKTIRYTLTENVVWVTVAHIQQSQLSHIQQQPKYHSKVKLWPIKNYIFVCTNSNEKLLYIISPYYIFAVIHNKLKKYCLKFWINLWTKYCYRILQNFSSFLFSTKYAKKQYTLKSIYKVTKILKKIHSRKFQGSRIIFILLIAALLWKLKGFLDK